LRYFYAEGRAKAITWFELRLVPVRRAQLRWGYEHLQRTTRSARKRLQRLIAPAPESQTQVALILGAQRSGTTLMLDLLDRDRRSVTFPEKSVFSLPDDSLRLRPLAEVRESLAGVSAPLVVLKPLVESQRAPELLDALPGAKVIWMVRTYRDVAVSNMRTFGADNPARDLQLLLTNEPPNWRGEYVPVETRRVVGQFVSENLSPADAAALFWWARNMLAFQLGLVGRGDVHLCSYEQLVEAPREGLAKVYRFLNLPPPRRDPSRSVRANAIARGASARLLPEVDQLCSDLYQRLQSAFDPRRAT
jgi:hypothetical protein